MVSPKEVAEANELIAYERLGATISHKIEEIRSAVSKRIMSGTVKVGGLRHREGSEEPSRLVNPTFDLLALTKYCGAIVTDDRAINRHPHVQDNGRQTPIFSSLDLLDVLASTGAVTVDHRLDCRTQLRRAGYLFVPVDEEEVEHHLLASPVEDRKVIETAELRAIRENILLARMTGWLRSSEEADWPLKTILRLIKALKAIWTSCDADILDIEARANWIASQLNLCGWAHTFGAENGDNFVKAGRAELLLLLIAVPSDIPRKLKDAYLGWVEDNFLAEVEEQYPKLYERIVKRERKLISE